MDILIIEDNKLYCEKLAEDLIAYNYNISICKDFSHLEEIDYSRYNLVLLDISLPNIDGRSMINIIKTSSKANVIMLTSDNANSSEFESLKLGADDYIIKPHFMPVLDLKIQQLINTPSDVIKICGHLLNKQNMKIDDNINLTAKEYKILMCLYSKSDQVCSKSEVLKNLWQSDFFVESGALYTLIHRLRKKLENTNINIKNVKGGYQIDN